MHFQSRLYQLNDSTEKLFYGIPSHSSPQRVDESVSLFFTHTDGIKRQHGNICLIRIHNSACISMNDDNGISLF